MRLSYALALPCCGKVPAAGGGGGGITDPTEIPGLFLWLDAENNGFTGADDNPLETWLDLSGNGWDFNQLTEGVQPIYKTGIVNGKGVARFSGGQFMDGPAALSVNSYTIFFVLAGAGTTQDYVFWFADNNNAFTHSYGDSVFGHWNGTSTCGMGDIGNGVFHSHTMTSEDEGARIGYRDGVLTETEVGGLTVNPSTWRVGTRGGGAEGFSGDIAEIIVYEGVLSTTDQQLVEGYLRTKYALP